MLSYSRLRRVKKNKADGIFRWLNNTLKQVLSLTDGIQSYKILVVDDIDNNRQYVVYALKSAGFDVQEAENSENALDIWKKMVLRGENMRDGWTPRVYLFSEIT
ncbi:Signal transduction response regulator, receiver region domain protein [Candidatus Magnetomorum sp. HK-1]|nr:Signal transduction response regulator, receiver region domain protein [Candidatus Magnetomorum sp. HK-1]